jgi:hypothetical protein
MFMRDVGLKENSVRAAYRDPGECVSRSYPLLHTLTFDNLLAFLKRHLIKWNRRSHPFLGKLEVAIYSAGKTTVKAKRNNSNQAVHNGAFGLGKARTVSIGC